MNKREGYGCFVWANGNYFYGSWKDDKKDGEGKFCVNVKGRLEVQKQRWKDGELVGFEIDA